ncbi:hypothetical protein IW262DRAFT_504533 [Armillaria fumosa]|nr:hypothetical protein IW262DRAFT_504533 [Armillaria fumosa]
MAAMRRYDSLRGMVSYIRPFMVGLAILVLSLCSNDLACTASCKTKILYSPTNVQRIIDSSQRLPSVRIRSSRAAETLPSPAFSIFSDIGNDVKRGAGAASIRCFSLYAVSAAYSS